MITHEVKCRLQKWRAIHAGDKTGDVLPNDRSYQTGDILIIKEFVPTTGRYTGNECHRRITHIHHSGQGGQFGIEPDYVLLSLAPVVVGYIVAGPEGGRMVADWTGEVHTTAKAGFESLSECQAAGYSDWRLYAMTEAETADD